MEADGGLETGLPLAYSGDETKPNPADFLEVLEDKTEVHR
jgi:hypothetical protein